jgi:hypothetical protein
LQIASGKFENSQGKLKNLLKMRNTSPKNSGHLQLSFHLKNKLLKRSNELPKFKSGASNQRPKKNFERLKLKSNLENYRYLDRFSLNFWQEMS